MKKILSALLLMLSLFTAPAAFAVRADITPKDPPSLVAGSITANSADFTFAAADASNYNQCAHTGRELLLVQNSDNSNAYTVTVTSKAIGGRTGDVSAYSVGANEFAVLGPFPLRGWSQTGRKLYFQGSNAAIKFAVIKIPKTI